jgi:hypothetical protein
VAFVVAFRAEVGADQLYIVGVFRVVHAEPDNRPALTRLLRTETDPPYGDDDAVPVINAIGLTAPGRF